jgi:anti-sigma factor RsiW
MNNHIDGTDISAFLDGELNDQERGRVDKHLSACHLCQSELASLRHFKRLLSTAPRRTLPADVALSLEHRLIRSTPWTSLRRVVPIGATAVAAILVGIFWVNRILSADELPLEPLLAAHTRYSAESLISEDNLVASNYSDQMNSLYSEGPDSEL